MFIIVIIVIVSAIALIIGSRTNNAIIEENKGNNDNELDDGPAISSERRVKSPTGALATKWKKTTRAEETDTKKSIVGDLSDDEKDPDTGSLGTKHEDMKIASLASLGRSIHETYSNSRIELAVNHETAAAMMSGLMSTDATEIFSPEPVAQVCREFGLRPGLSMVTKSG